MTTHSGSTSGAGTRFLMAVAALVIVVAGLRAASNLVLPFLVAAVIAVVSVPFMKWLRQYGVPQAFSALITVLGAMGVMALLVLIIGRSVNQFEAAVPRYRLRLEGLIDSVLNLLTRWGIPTTEWQTLDVLPGGVFDLLGGALGALASFASNTFLVLLTVVFILLEASGFGRKLQAAFGEGTDLAPFNRMTRQIQRYLVIKTAISALTGTIVGIWVAVMGLDFPLLWGLVAFLFNFIPTLGSILAAVPAVSLALIQLGPGQAAVIALGYVVVNVGFGSLVEPALMGRQLGLSTLVVFVSLVFWGWVWGPVGMLLSVPLTMVIKIALENTQDFRWVAVMLNANRSVRGGS